MPSFCICGSDKYISQICGGDFCSAEQPSKWLLIPTRQKKNSGNVCPSCQKTVEKPATTPTSIIKRIKQEQHGFISEKDLVVLVAEKRLHPCLVRCGSGRFTAPAQDIQHFIDIITKDGRDYVRDVSLCAG